MQTRYFKRLLPLTAVALLILAFLAIEMDETPCERRYVGYAIPQGMGEITE